MKKILSAALACVILLALVSCANGKSVPIEVVKRANLTGTLLADGTKAYTETVSFFKDGEEISYLFYFESAENAAQYSYNIVEVEGTYSLYAHEGNIYKQKGDALCAVLFANQALTYYQYIKDYADDSLEVKFPLDAGERYQTSSSEDVNYIYVSYYADVTPQMASAITAVSLKTGDKIISEYKLDKSYRVYSVEYKIEHQDGTIDLAARREYEYFGEKKDMFSSLPTGSDVNVTLIIGEREFEYVVPSGVYVEFEDGGLGYEYFTDAGFTQKYEVSKASEMTVYVKTNFE